MEVLAVALVGEGNCISYPGLRVLVFCRVIKAYTSSLSLNKVSMFLNSIDFAFPSYVCKSVFSTMSESKLINLVTQAKFLLTLLKGLMIRQLFIQL